MTLIDVNSEEKRALRRFQVALCVSLVLHVIALLKFGSFSSPTMATDDARLQVHLIGPVKTADRQAMKNEVSAEVAAVAAERAQLSPNIDRSVSDASAEKPERRSKTARTSPEPVANLSKSEVAPSAPLERAKQASPSPGLPLPGVTGRVNRAEIEFEMLTGAEKSALGRVTHLFESDVKESGEFYTLTVGAAPEEQSSDQAPAWQLTLRGHVSGKGLSARSYDLKGEASTRLFALREVSGSSAALKRGQTPDGILDRQSLLYHFSRQPPSFSGGGVWLADGTSHGYYRYSVEGFDQLSIPPHGNVRTLKMRLSETDAGEFIELWLAPDLNYLPVRVRHVDRKGVITEQLAKSLSFN